MMKRRLLVLASLAASLVAGSAGAVVMFLGGGHAEDCAKAVMAGKSDPDSEALCTSALETETLLNDDRAGTFVNRGIMRMRRFQYDGARADSTPVSLWPPRPARPGSIAAPSSSA
jgi:hypothetical protein